MRFAVGDAHNGAARTERGTPCRIALQSSRNACECTDSCAAYEFVELVDHWAKLDHRLQSFERRSIKLDLHIHDRDTAGQWVLLEAHIGGCRAGSSPSMRHAAWTTA